MRITRNTLASREEIDYFFLTPDHSINDLPASTNGKLKLNIVHLKINRMQKGECFADVVVRDNLVEAQRACIKGRWLRDFTWQSSDVHKANFRYRQALLFRLQGNPSRTRDAG